MSRNRQGTKTGRKERNIAFQRQLKDRKRLRKDRAAQHVQNPRSGAEYTVNQWDVSPVEAREAQIAVLEKETIKELKRRCNAQNLPVRSRDTKMSMILLLMGEHPRQNSPLVVPS